MLRKLRDERKEKLVELSKAFPDDVKIFAQLSYGGVERRILHAAEEGVSFFFFLRMIAKCFLS